MASKVMLAPLTSLRLVAALVVVAHHYFGFEAGYAGVSFFFVLSGFILAFNYPPGAIEPRAFWFRRFSRIWPTHALTFVVAVPIGLDAGHLLGSAASAVLNLALLQSWIPSPAVYFGFNALSWSISNEAFFYALFPLLLAWLAGVGPTARWSILALWAALLVAGAAAWFAVFGYVNPLAGVTHYVWYINPAVRLFEFVLGMALALHFMSGAKPAMSLAEECGAVLFAAGSLALLPWIPPPFSLSLAFIPGWVVVVYVFACGGGPLARVLSFPLLVLLGEASFMLYMIHQLVQMYLLPGGSGTLVQRAALAVAVVAASVALHICFEKPVQRALLKRRARAALAAP
jgi:peptidoglycan/LPS O-acetylase OafA/YrhL